MSGLEGWVPARGIILPFPLPEFATAALNELLAQGYQLQRNPHLTVASAEFMQSLADDETAATYRQVLGTIATTDIRLEQKLYRIEKPKLIGEETYQRVSLVALVADQQSFVAKLQASCEAAGLIWPQTFPHVTVMTFPDTEVGRRGIGISNADEWDGLNPELVLEGWQANP